MVSARRVAVDLDQDNLAAARELSRETLALGERNAKRHSAGLLIWNDGGGDKSCLERSTPEHDALVPDAALGP
jgi:hypothetical protein